MNAVAGRCRLLCGATIAVMAAGPVIPSVPTLQAQDFTVTPITTPRPRDPTYALPLVPTRTVRFTTDEGTWMSVDVSPDGSTILFDLLGDLYTVPMNGGQARRIMGGMAMDIHPRYAPDGTRIVFISDRSGRDNVWIAEADGGHPRPVPVAPDTSLRYNMTIYYRGGGLTDAVWTPDGRAIVADGRLYPLSGGASQALPAEAHKEVAFGGDPRYAYFPVPTQEWWGDRIPEDQGDGVLVYDFQREQIRPVLRWPHRVIRPIVSRDNRWLVYVTQVDLRTELRLHDLRTGEERWLARDIQHDASYRSADYGRFPGYAFTPDSRAIVIADQGKLWRIAVPSGTRTPIPFQAEVELDLGPLSRFSYPVPDSFPVHQIREPRLSPDGTRLAFIALDKLYLMRFPDGVPRRVTSGERRVEHSPAWSPDGAYLAFAAHDDFGDGHIYRVPVSKVGGPRPLLAHPATPERLTRARDLYLGLAYSSDGTRLVFTRVAWREFVAAVETGEYAQELAWMDAAGGAVHPLLHLTDRNDVRAPNVPQFLARDSARVLISSRAQPGTVVSVRWDGRGERTVLTPVVRARGLNASPTLTSIAPDGAHAFTMWRGNLYLYSLPAGELDSVSIPVIPADPSTAVRRISRAGAEFPAWTADSRKIYYALGRSLFVYDLASRDARPTRYDIPLTVHRDIPAGTLVLRGARLITMQGDEVIEDGDLVVRHNRIAALGPRGTVAVPPGADILDVTGATIIPGYVDLHAHMYPPHGIHKTQIPSYLAQLAYGVTTTRDPQTATTDVLTYADRVAAGEMLGPRIFSTGPGIGPSGADELDTYDQARAVVRRYAEFFRTETVKQYLAGQRKVRQHVVMATHELGLGPTTEGSANLKMAISNMIDGYAGQEHNNEVFPVYRDVTLLMAATGITYTPTLVVTYGGPQAVKWWRTVESPLDDAKMRRFTVPERLRGRVTPWIPDDQHVFPDFAANLAKIVAAGGHVGVGAHGEPHGVGVHWELRSIGSGGMHPHDVLRAGTIVGARAIGHDRDLGSLEPGKLADLQVLDRNPLEDLRHIGAMRYVMKNGRLYDAATLDELWPRRRKLGRQWWWMLTPPPETARAR